jgi:hypothetical protein
MCEPIDWCIMKVLVPLYALPALLYDKERCLMSLDKDSVFLGTNERHCQMVKVIVTWRPGDQ